MDVINNNVSLHESIHFEVGNMLQTSRILQTILSVSFKPLMDVSAVRDITNMVKWFN